MYPLPHVQYNAAADIVHVCMMYLHVFTGIPAFTTIHALSSWLYVNSAMLKILTSSMSQETVLKPYFRALADAVNVNHGALIILVLLAS